ncbi:MAG: hypothetical protein K2N63_08850 [Lachnospiraceae bacterium]|nr:hypothetical protein [Lachnospiraceae bacterium]
MTPDEIINYCLENLEGTILVNSWGEQGIFYNPDRKLKRGIYVLTIKEKDGDNDRSSNLNREDVYRMNLGVRKSTFSKLFGPLPKRPAKGCTVDVNCDFSAVNVLLPHPVYAWMGWICALNPSSERFEELKPLIQEAYEYAKEKYRKRKI